MAKLLVFLRDNEVERGCRAEGAYKPGDVVGVFADDHVFSDLEQAYPFAVVSAVLPAGAADQAAMIDNQLIISRAARLVPSIRRRAAADPNNLRPRRRRRYRWQADALIRK